MAQPHPPPQPEDTPDDAVDGGDATLDGTHEPAFPQVDADNTEDAEDE
ncbi:MAG TPA: hypothetical protein VD903_18875 [Pseudonocardia sp.]|nr:hypothetical protein [Pseudonocardia sp.]